MCDTNEIPVHGTPMKTVDVNGRQYELRLSPKPLLDAEKVRCEILIDHRRRIIWLDPLGYTPGSHRLIVAAALGTAHAWAEVAAGEHVGPWQGIRQHLLRSRVGHVGDLADDFEAVAEELGYLPETLLAMALHAATDWEPDDAAHALANLRIHYAAAGTAPNGADSSPQATPTGEHEALPPHEQASPRDVLLAQWRIMAPGWPLPPNLPADVYLEPPPRLAPDGVPPFIMQRCGDDDRVFCPHCGRPYRNALNLFRCHLVPRHGWGRDAGGCAVPAAMAVPPRTIPFPQRHKMLAAIRGDGRGRIVCPAHNCGRSYCYPLSWAQHAYECTGDRRWIQLIHTDEARAAIRLAKEWRASDARCAA
jgi:hypothetical protein